MNCKFLWPKSYHDEGMGVLTAAQNNYWFLFKLALGIFFLKNIDQNHDVNESTLHSVAGYLF